MPLGLACFAQHFNVQLCASLCLLILNLNHTRSKINLSWGSQHEKKILSDWACTADAACSIWLLPVPKTKRHSMGYNINGIWM